MSGGRISLVLSAALVVACAKPPQPRTLRIAYESDALTLDPMRFQDDASRSVQSNVYEGLVTFDENMAIVPALASGWTNPDERTWEFRLRRGVVFHDGTPLTAEEVRRALEFGRADPRSTVKGELSALEAIEAVDANTIRLRTRQPAPFLLSSLADARIARAPDTGRERLAGTGPFRIVSRQGGLLQTAAFEGYWGGKPAIDRTTFVHEDAASAVRALAKGEIDVAGSLPASLLGELAAVKGVRVVERAGLNSYYLWLDGRSGAGNPFADRRVRRALSLAIDRKGLVARLGGHGAPLNQISQKGVLGHVADLPELPFDPPAARRLLSEAGWPKGISAELVHGPDVTATLTAQALREMLGAVGVRVTPRERAWAELLSDWQHARVPFLLAGWRENGDPTTFLRDCLLTRDAAGRGSFNTGTSNAELDRLIDEADHVDDMAQRLARYEKVTRLAIDEMAVVPLYTRTSLYGVSTRIRFEPRIDGKLLAATMALQAP